MGTEGNYFGYTHVCDTSNNSSSSSMSLPFSSRAAHFLSLLRQLCLSCLWGPHPLLSPDLASLKHFEDHSSLDVPFYKAEERTSYIKDLTTFYLSIKYWF